MFNGLFLNFFYDNCGYFFDKCAYFCDNCVYFFGKCAYFYDNCAYFLTFVHLTFFFSLITAVLPHRTVLLLSSFL